MSQPILFNDFQGSIIEPDSIFEDKVFSEARDGDAVLDAGSSDGNFGMLSKLKESKGTRVVGLDIDIEALANNPWLDERVVGNLEKMPLEDNTFDLIVCRSVFEHLQKPDKVMEEFARVLKPGGHVFMSTFNLYHPQNLLSALLPLGLRDWLKKKLINPEVVEGTYPTYYRCNTKRSFSKLARAAGLKETTFGRYSTPHNYWSSRFVSTVFLLHERITDIGPFKVFKPIIVSGYRKE